MEEKRRDLVLLSTTWARVSARFKANVAATGGEIRTVDGGTLKLVDGQWEVLESGDLNEADLVRNALRRPS